MKVSSVPIYSVAATPVVCDCDEAAETEAAADDVAVEVADEVCAVEAVSVCSDCDCREQPTAEAAKTAQTAVNRNSFVFIKWNPFLCGTKNKPLLREAYFD